MVRFETEVYEKREQDLVGVQVIVSEETFQSHYRSDFNHIYINMYTCCYLISIPL